MIILNVEQLKHVKQTYMSLPSPILFIELNISFIGESLFSFFLEKSKKSTYIVVSPSSQSQKKSQTSQLARIRLFLMFFRLLLDFFF